MCIDNPFYSNLRTTLSRPVRFLTKLLCIACYEQRRNYRQLLAARKRGAITLQKTWRGKAARLKKVRSTPGKISMALSVVRGTTVHCSRDYSVDLKESLLLLHVNSRPRSRWSSVQLHGYRRCGARTTRATTHACGSCYWATPLSDAR